MLAFISGKKTYLVAFVMCIVSVLKIFNLIDSLTYEGIMGVLAALGFGALRAGVESTFAHMKDSSDGS